MVILRKGKPLNVLDLFSGIGGFSLGLHRAGMTTVAFCECEPYPQAVLRKNFPGVPIYDDVRTLTNDRLRTDGIDRVDLVCGGFPCQPFTIAGKQRGKDDHRYLWPEMFRIIQEIRPAWVIGENVAGFVDMELCSVSADMESARYEVQPFIIPACAVGSPQRRDRVWILAHTTSGGCAELQHQGVTAELRQPCGGDAAQGRASWWESEPGVDRVADGISFRLDRIRGLGNAVVPQIPEIIGRAIMGAIDRVI